MEVGDLNRQSDGMTRHKNLAKSLKELRVGDLLGLEIKETVKHKNKQVSQYRDICDLSLKQLHRRFQVMDRRFERITVLGFSISTQDVPLLALVRVIAISCPLIEYLNIVAWSAGRKFPGRVGQYQAIASVLKYIPQLKKYRFGFLESVQELFMLSRSIPMSKLEDLGFMSNFALTSSMAVRFYPGIFQSKHLQVFRTHTTFYGSSDFTAYFKHLCLVQNIDISQRFPPIH